MTLHTEKLEIRRALLSVSDKTGIDTLVKALHKNNVEIISSGGTRKYIEDLGIPVIAVENITGNPEAFEGRMKTLSFEISSALLFRRNHQGDVKQAEDLGIRPIDLVVCNLYPFENAAKANSDWNVLIENVDIGGPTMIRAAAKNFEHVCTMTNPDQYQTFIDEFTLSSTLSFDSRKTFALEAFRHTADYDSMITKTFFEKSELKSPILHMNFTQGKRLRYGENPHQTAKVIVDKKKSLASTLPVQGKELSFNNLMDADAAWRCVLDLEEVKEVSGHKASCVIIKHANPCGAALSVDGPTALEKAWAGDSVSAFGSIIAFGQEVTLTEAKWLGNKFVEVILAPKFSSEAKEIFSKKKNLRLLEIPLDQTHVKEPMVRKICGGYLVQDEDTLLEREFQPMTDALFSSEDDNLRTFGVIVTKHLKSNAISLVQNIEGSCMLIGAGMGNPNRLVSTKQAVEKAQENGFNNLSHSILVSDAFFPFRDNIDLAKEYGISKVIQPGGSIRDEEVINACNEHGIAMTFTGKRHFRH
jgi:phosphoribosylaminoimidazolecarboxamide formyltransferase/IMP cyclohydrolase